MQTAQLSQSSLDEIISIIERNQSKCSNLKQNISLSLNYENELSRLTTQFLYDLSYDLRTILAALDRSRVTNVNLNNQLQSSERKIAELSMKCQNYQRQIFELESALCELNRKITELTSVNQNNQNYIEELLIKLRLNSDRKNCSFYEGTDYLSKNKSMLSTTYEFEDFANSSIRKNPSIYNLKKLNFDYDMNDNFNYNYKLGNSYYNEDSGYAGRNTFSEGRVNVKNSYERNSLNNDGFDRIQSNSNRDYISVFSGRKLNDGPNQNFDNSYKLNNFNKSLNNQPNYQNSQQNYDDTYQKYHKLQNNLNDNTQYIRATVNLSQNNELNQIKGNNDQEIDQNEKKNNNINNNLNNQQNENIASNEEHYNNQEKQNDSLNNNGNINSKNITENESLYNNNSSLKNSNKNADSNFKNDVGSIKNQNNSQPQEVTNDEVFYKTKNVDNSSYQTPVEKQSNQLIQPKSQNTLLQNKIIDNNQIEQSQIPVTENLQHEDNKLQQQKRPDFDDSIQSQTQKIYKNYQNQKNSKNDIKETNQSIQEDPRLSKEKITKIQKIVMEAFKDEETVNQLREKLGDDFEDKLTKGDINEEYLDKVEEALNEIKQNKKGSPQKISKRLQIAQGAHTKKKAKAPMKDQMYYKTQLKKAITDKQCHYKEYPRGWNSSKDYFVNNNSSDGRIEKSPMKIPNIPK